MPTYRRETRIEAPLDVVWDFHSRKEGLEALTPDWMGLDVESVVGPDGEPDPTVLDVGSELHLVTRPLDIGPRQRVVSRIVEREEREGAAHFSDEMVEGPFREWLHTHTFFADGDATILRDEVGYRLPLGAAGDAVGPLAKVGFAPMFRFRHRRTRELLDGRTTLPPGFGPGAD